MSGARSRTYIPEWGAFTGPDWKIDITETIGQGSYIFPHNNPLMYRDPTGLYEVKGADRKKLLRVIEEMIAKLRKTEWGRSERGRLILNAYKPSEIRFFAPEYATLMYKGKPILHGDNAPADKRGKPRRGLMFAKSDELQAAIEGSMVRISKWTVLGKVYDFEVSISLTHMDEKQFQSDKERFFSSSIVHIGPKNKQVIPKLFLLHILIDELASRVHAGKFFVNGGAPYQEEKDAFEAAQEAVQAFYGGHLGKQAAKFTGSRFKVSYGTTSNPSYSNSHSI